MPIEQVSSMTGYSCNARTPSWAEDQLELLVPAGTLRIGKNCQHVFFFDNVTEAIDVIIEVVMKRIHNSLFLAQAMNFRKLQKQLA